MKQLGRAEGLSRLGFGMLVGGEDDEDEDNEEDNEATDADDEEAEEYEGSEPEDGAEAEHSQSNHQRPESESFVSNGEAVSQHLRPVHGGDCVVRWGAFVLFFFDISRRCATAVALCGIQAS